MIGPEKLPKNKRALATTGVLQVLFPRRSLRVRGSEEASDRVSEAPGAGVARTGDDMAHPRHEKGDPQIQRDARS